MLSAPAARALAQRLADAAADGRETCVWNADFGALALTVGGVATHADGSAWCVAARTVREDGVRVELRRHQPLALAALPADPGVPVAAPDWPDATGVVQIFDLPNLGQTAASTAQMLIAGAGTNDGWRGANCWLVPAPGVEPIPVGALRPAAALGALAEPLAVGDPFRLDLAHAALVTLANPSMTLESVGDAALLGGANRAMIGSELLQFGSAEPVGPGLWRLSRLLRGRAGTEDVMAHTAGTSFVLLGDAALLPLTAELAGWAESGGAVVQWAPRNGTDLIEIPVPARARALNPLAPVHGRARADGAGVALSWVRRTRADSGWRDHVDQPIGESREHYRVTTSVAVPGVGPWDCDAPVLDISAADIAALPPGTSAEIRQVGDYALSPPLVMPLT